MAASVPPVSLERCDAGTALFNNCSKELELYTDSHSKIRALCFLNCGKIELHEDAFTSQLNRKIADFIFKEKYN